MRSVDFNRVMMYWHLGRRIFEAEQHGKRRADYGSHLIRSLAERLEPNTVEDLNIVNLLIVTNSIGLVQLRTHCVHNWIGCNITF